MEGIRINLEMKKNSMHMTYIHIYKLHSKGPP